MNKISQRDVSNKEKVEKFISSKFPKGIHSEIYAEISSGYGGNWSSVPEIPDKELGYYINPLKKMTLLYNEPQIISIDEILKHPNNDVLRGRLEAVTSKSNDSKSQDPSKNIRNPKNVEKYKNLDPSTQPPIAISNGGKVEWGFHRIIASILRGDTKIKAWIFK